MHLHKCMHAHINAVHARTSVCPYTTVYQYTVHKHVHNTSVYLHLTKYQLERCKDRLPLLPQEPSNMAYRGHS